MLIDLSDIASKQGKVVEKICDLEFETFPYAGNRHLIKEKTPVTLCISNVGNQEVEIEGKTHLEINIPCDRCLTDVVTVFDLKISKKIDMKDSAEDRIESLDEMNFMIGNELDVDQLVRNEIVVNWPMKVLCNEDCKGICKNCGTNLNQETCNCNTSELDPRMAAIWDVFNDNKEV